MIPRPEPGALGPTTLSEPPAPLLEQKRQELLAFVEAVLEPESAVRGVVAVGSIVTGRLRAGSDIDLVVFMDPLDWYIVPGEFIWRPSDGSFHSSFTVDEQLRQEGLELDCLRLDLRVWTDADFEWPEGYRADLHRGWLLFDRLGQVANLIAERTEYPEAIRQARLDEALVWLGQHLHFADPVNRWHVLGPLIAHDRLAAAYQNLVQALFAYNRRWLPWRNRQLDALLDLPWLPDKFSERILEAANAPSLDQAGYEARVAALHTLFSDVLDRLVADGDYSATPVDQAFIRSHDEPGYAWNMDEWNAENLRRVLAGLEIRRDDEVSESPD